MIGLIVAKGSISVAMHVNRVILAMSSFQTLCCVPNFR